MTTQYTAVFGDPVEGNPTSIMQNAAFEHAGLDWRYLDIRVRAEDRVTRVGYLPREVAAQTMAESRRLRSAFGALVVFESRDRESGQRRDIRVLVGPWKVWASTT